MLMDQRNYTVVTPQNKILWRKLDNFVHTYVQEMMQSKSVNN